MALVPVEQIEGRTQGVAIHLDNPGTLNGGTITLIKTMYEVTNDKRDELGRPIYEAVIEHDGMWIIARHNGIRWEAYANKNQTLPPESVAYREDLPEEDI